MPQQKQSLQTDDRQALMPKTKKMEKDSSITLITRINTKWFTDEKAPNKSSKPNKPHTKINNLYCLIIKITGITQNFPYSDFQAHRIFKPPL
jgi:hypothetical protein